MSLPEASLSSGADTGPKWRHPLRLQGSWEGLIHKDSESQPPTRGPAPCPQTRKPHARGQARAGSTSMDMHALSTEEPGQAHTPGQARHVRRRARLGENGSFLASGGGTGSGASQGITAVLSDPHFLSLHLPVHLTHESLEFWFFHPVTAS